MSKKISWALAVCILLFLMARTFCNHIEGVKDEKVWYLHQLGFEFSGELDSAERPGQVIFHVTSGTVNRSKESELQKQLRYNGVLELFLYRSNGTLDLVITEPHDFIPGDSLYLNSNQGVVRFHRKGEMLSEHHLIKSLRGRPF